MRPLFLLIISCCLMVCLVMAGPVNFKSVFENPRPKSLPRIAIAGLGIESSTFSPALTDEAAFHTKYGTMFSLYTFSCRLIPTFVAGRYGYPPWWVMHCRAVR